MRNQEGSDLNARAPASVYNSAVAAPIPVRDAPGGVMRDRKLHSREVVSIDPVLEDRGCELLGGNPAGEHRPEELAQ